MTVLKALGIDQISGKIVFLVIITLILVGLATNSLFELYKMSPTIFMEDNVVPDWESVLLYLFWIFVFFIWVLYSYRKYKHRLTASVTVARPTEVKPHKGIVFALSKPTISEEQINNAINNADENNMDSIYNLWGIGQLFKGMYHHKDAPLLFIWPLTTRESKKFLGYLEMFASKFVPNAQIKWDENTCHLTEENDLDLIEQTKSKLTLIYLKENLDQYCLKKSDIIVDISGGTKPISIGLTFAAIDSAIDIQYVEQKNYNVIPLTITPDIILDKIGEYLLELYANIHKSRMVLSHANNERN